jgi:hypothetical protein
MNLVNAMAMKAGWSLGTEPSGTERLVVVVKGTFTLPPRGEEPKLAEEQVPLTDADEFTGEPGLSAVKAECDWAPVKPRCDILLNGGAYAPGGRPATRVQVGIKLGNWQKVFTVVGNRVWRGGAVTRQTAPEPFEVMPISYDNAFGGVDNFHPDPGRHRTYLPNPVGRGYHHLVEPHYVDGTPLPNTEETNATVTTPNGDYHPMAFGPVGRNFASRYPLAGTYDQHWIDNVFPFLPADFNTAYFQAAPEDQQVERISGGEQVILLNLTRDGRREFLLPVLEVPVSFFLRKGGRVEMKTVIDTVIIEPDEQRLMVVWRTSIPLSRDIFEVPEIVVGAVSRARLRASETGKAYFSSLGKAVDAHRAQMEQVE